MPPIPHPRRNMAFPWVETKLASGTRTRLDGHTRRIIHDLPEVCPFFKLEDNGVTVAGEVRESCRAP